MYCCLIAGLSFIAGACNFLGLLLPNLGRCARLSYDYRPVEPINQPLNADRQLVYGVQPQNQKTLVETYPEPQEVIQAQISKPVAPIYADQNQGYDTNIGGNSFDAPAPVYQQPINEVNNQVNIPYPSPQ